MSTRKFTGKCHWFVEPLDNQTNDSIAKKLAENCEENAVHHLTDNQGIKHDLWRCPSYSFLKILINSRHSLNLRFDIYRCMIRTDGSYGPLTPTNFFLKVNPA